MGEKTGMGGVFKQGRQSSNCNKSYLYKHIRYLKKYKTTSENNTERKERVLIKVVKNWRAGLWQCLENLGALWEGTQLVPVLSWLVLCSCQNPSSRGFRLGSLTHRDLTSLITYGKLALTCFCAIEYGKEGKMSKWNCSERGCGRGSSPRGALSWRRSTQIVNG